MANEESILGLLLRALVQIAEQKHGERYVHKNVPTSMDYEQAERYVTSAIGAVFIAERSEARFEKNQKFSKCDMCRSGVTGSVHYELVSGNHRCIACTNKMKELDEPTTAGVGTAKV